EEGILLHRFPAAERDLDRSQLAHVTAYLNALGSQILAGNGTGRHPHGGFPGRGAAAATIVADAVFVVVGVIRVGRTEQVLDGRVVLGLLDGVEKQQIDRLVSDAPLVYAGEDLDFVWLLTLGGVAAGARLAPVQTLLRVRCPQLQFRGAATDGG